ncbi:MAG: glycosyltransferase family 2 protein [Pseudomonadota bacterium]
MKKKVIVVMPAYNAAETLERTYKDIPSGHVDEIILVDDNSKDSTVKIAESLGIHTIVHPENRGYGGNQKTCYTEALKRGADIIIMIHPDYQYDSRLVPYILGFLDLGICDIVLGSRIRTRHETIQCGMPAYKYIFNRMLTTIENIVLGQNVSDFHTGYRAYTRQVLETIPFMKNSDNFVFDTEFLVQAVYFGFRIGCVPVPVRYFSEASSINFANSFVYGLKTLGALVKFVNQHAGIKKYPFFDRR